MNKERKSPELAEIHRLKTLNDEMLRSLKDVVELMEGDTGEWIDGVKALIAKVEANT
jgi:hypothetical protein